MLPYNKKLVQNAQKLRKNMTPQERKLWYNFLKTLPLTVHRQHNIENYIVDFYIAETKTVIEIDGSQHGEPEHAEKDASRDADLAAWGITVLRYSNRDLNRNFIAVAEDILTHLGLNNRRDHGFSCERSCPARDVLTSQRTDE